MAKLPLRTKLIFGLGGLGMNLCDLLFLQWMFVRYSGEGSSALVPAVMLGRIIMLGRIGECFYNLGVGHWSDNFRSKLGRRIPFMRRGVVPLALVFFLMFVPPTGQPVWVACLYVFVLLQLYLFLYAAVVTPYLSLLPELTSDVNERISLTISQSAFVVVSMVLFSLVGFVLEHGGWYVTAGLVSVITIGALLPAAFMIHERQQAPEAHDDRPPFLVSMKLTLKNPAFLYIATSTSCYWFSVQMIMALVPLWVINVLGRSESDVSLVMAPMLGVTVLGFFLFGALIQRVGKYPMFLITLALSAVAFALICAVGHLPFGSPFMQAVGVVAFAGLGVSGFMVIPFALLADAVDHEEERTGHRREAMFFSMQGVCQKTMLGISALLFPYLVYWGGDKMATAAGVKLVGLAASAACVAAFVLFLKYPLRERDGRVVLKGG